MGKELIKIFVTNIKTAEKTEIAIQGLTSDFLKSNEIPLRRGATSLFDVQRWTFDVRRSSFETITATCEHL